MAAAKNGSPVTLSSGSGTTKATESARWVTSVRAARFGLNPNRRTAASTAASASGLTLAPPLMALDAVDRDTPAAAATSSRVGDAPADRARGPTGPETTLSSTRAPSPAPVPPSGTVVNAGCSGRGVPGAGHLGPWPPSGRLPLVACAARPGVHLTAPDPTRHGEPHHQSIGARRGKVQIRAPGAAGVAHSVTAPPR